MDTMLQTQELKDITTRRKIKKNILAHKHGLK